MTTFENLIIKEPKDIYEIAALTLDRETAILFLLDVLKYYHSKSEILTKIINQELGEGWWTMYQDQLTQEEPEDYDLSVVVKQGLDEGISQVDIPI